MTGANHRFQSRYQLRFSLITNNIPFLSRFDFRKDGQYRACKNSIRALLALHAIQRVDRKACHSLNCRHDFACITLIFAVSTDRYLDVIRDIGRKVILAGRLHMGENIFENATAGVSCGGKSF